MSIPLHRLPILPLVAAACLAASGAEPTPNTTLLIRPRIAVASSTITLADVVMDPATLPAGWSERRVLDAPEPGQSLTSPLALMVHALQQYPDMRQVTLRGPVRLIVQRHGVLLDPLALQNAVKQFIADKAEWKTMKIRTEFMSIPDHIMVGSTNVLLGVTRFEYEPRSAAYLFHLDIRDDDRTARVAVPARLSALCETWVAARALPEGAVLTADDVKVQGTEAGLDDARIIPVTEDITGFELSRQVLAGETLHRTMLQQPVCTERGSLVAVTARRNSLEISLRAKALAKGRRGDVIACINENSKRQFSVRLTAPGKAIVAEL